MKSRSPRTTGMLLPTPSPCPAPTRDTQVNPAVSAWAPPRQGNGGGCRSWGITSWSPARPVPARARCCGRSSQALAPGIWAGWIRVLVVDPKGGMEFGRGQKLFSGFAYDNGHDTLALLRAATKIMQQRAQRLRGHTRLHGPYRR